MKRSFRAGLLCAALLFCGCSQTNLPTKTLAETRPTLPSATICPDGDPHTVTSLGSYTGTGNMDAIVARIEDASLTNAELQFWYGAEVAQYRQKDAEPKPDFSLPLETQPCPLDHSVNSWQQYFLKAALNRWHTANALICHSQKTPLPLEDAYTGDPKILVDYMGQMPANRLLYGYDPWYRPNSLHQHFLDGLEGKLTGPQLDMARDLNYGYMYFTTLTYRLDPDIPEAAGDLRVHLRHILLRPEEGKESCLQRADELLKTWQNGKNPSESTFAQLASQYSQDAATAKSGGLYAGLSRQQLPEVIAQWCFDSARQKGDTTLIPIGNDVHILYFVASETNTETRQALRQQAQCELLEQIRSAYPIETDYDRIVLKEDISSASVSNLLYPDIAHERFPEIPLYLQQNYTGTMYGNYKLTTNGCGITSLAMLGSYLCDEELTPPELCAVYGSYSHPNGTAGSLFEDAPPQLGFYLIKKTYDWREAREYMQEGHSVIVCQHKGYWTGGGHYLVLETQTEDGLVRVRDSNLYNYRKLPRHKDDAFPWETLCSAGQGYWIYEKKVTSIDACIRCGNPEALEAPLVTDYLCEKCNAALCRRNAYLSYYP